MTRAARVNKACQLYENFSGHKAEVMGEVEKPKLPDTAILIGPLLGVAYETIRDGKKERYYHEFDKNSQPLLCSSFDGKAIFILGGEYEFTELGITDYDPKTGEFLK